MFPYGEFVYGIRVLPYGPVKLGRTNNPKGRLAALQTGAHEELAIIWRESGDMHAERRLHTIFANVRVRGEFFDFGDIESERIAQMLTRAMAMSPIPIKDLRVWLASWPSTE